ncbi:hypothetical protein N8869_01560, partial [Candidatus Pelagibacter sp.]|nr:hypothetical protein [Candidatus Pelagibacter sp.]
MKDKLVFKSVDACLEYMEKFFTNAELEPNSMYSGKILHMIVNDAGKKTLAYVKVLCLIDGKRINQDSDKFYTYLDYDIDGWQNKVLTKSNNGKIELVLYLSNGCYRQNSYFKIFFENKE